MKIEHLYLDEYDNLTRFSYKPGWSFKFRYVDHHIAYELRILHKSLPDASKFKESSSYQNNEYLDEKIPVVHRSTIYPETFKKMIANDFYNYIFDRIKDVEFHEIKEWAKVDGKYLRNPHPDDGMVANSIPDEECIIF